MEKSEFDLRFGEFVKILRNEQGWSQPELAAKLGNNFQNISRLENGKVSPTFYWVNNLSAAFELELPEFVSRFYSFLHVQAGKK